MDCKQQNKTKATSRSLLFATVYTVLNDREWFKDIRDHLPPYMLQQITRQVIILQCVFFKLKFLRLVFPDILQT